MGKDKSKKGTKDGESKFDGFGVDFKCKLIGIMDVPAARGDDICQTALSKLTALALKNNKEKKGHKQRITVNITFKGIRLLDEASERIDHAHPIHRISFISHDDTDKRSFGYIVGTKEGYKLFAIKAMKEAEQITKTLKDLFQAVFERHQAQKNSNQENEAPAEVNATVAVVEEKPTEVGQEADQESADPFLVDWGQLNEQIQVMQNDGMKRSDTSELFANPPFEPNDPFNDSFNSKLPTQQNNTDFNPFGDNAAPTQQVNKAPAKSPSEDLFALHAPPPAKSNTNLGDEPLLMNDPFADLKKNINELHKQNQMQQQQQQFGFQSGFNQMQPGLNQPPAAFPAQPNPYQPAAPNPYMPPQQANNPFGPMYGGGNTMTGNMNQPPVLPARPAPSTGPNPFLSQQSAQPTEGDMGWTVTKPTPVPRNAIKKPVSSTGPDPFSFLDFQTENKAPQEQQTAAMQLSSNGNANNDIFDLLG